MSTKNRSASMRKVSRNIVGEHQKKTVKSVETESESIKKRKSSEQELADSSQNILHLQTSNRFLIVYLHICILLFVIPS